MYSVHWKKFNDNMDNEQRKKLEILLVTYLDGSATEQQCAEIDGILAESLEACQFYCEFMQIAMGVWQVDVIGMQLMQQNQQNRSVFLEVINEDISRNRLPDKQLEPKPKISNRVSSVSRSAVPPLGAFLRLFGAITTLVMIGFILNQLTDFIPAYRATERRLEVAKVFRVLKTNLKSGSNTYTTGNKLMPGKYVIDGGFVELGFLKGATVIVQGPSAFVLVDENTMELEQGRLTAKVSIEAQGFTVKVPNGEMVDLGTEFGIEVDGNQDSILHVFDGKVSAMSKLDSGKATSKLITEGQTRKLLAKTGAIDSIPFVSGKFLRSWGEANYRLISQGQVVYEEHLPASLEEDAAERYGLAVLYQEQRGVKLDQDMAVSLTRPGTYSSEIKITDIVPKDNIVDSYLLHVDLAGRVHGKSQGDEYIAGSITFQRPVVGVIIDYFGLTKTDGFLGNINTIYGNSEGRGLVEGTGGILDEIIISEDRCTLEFGLYVGNIDQFRILVQSP
ncbi:MAG: FecR domain-containing protein [Phycisphaerae bacterium]|nr:FecR domain-containing protein [Phycisphaerae bacterium]